jgi:hypothetical protein
MSLRITKEGSESEDVAMNAQSDRYKSLGQAELGLETETSLVHPFISNCSRY